MILLIYTLVFAFAFGAAIGSFLNVVIYRVPAGLSVVHPPSRCPTCKTEIRWYDNIPVVSWILLRGKCRVCKTPISPRYALIEALTGVLAAVIWWQVATPVFSDFSDPTEIPWIWIVLPFTLRFTFLALLVVIAFVDLDHFIIPHQFTIPGMVLGLATPWLYEYILAPNWLLMRWLWPPVTPLVSVIGFVLGGVVIVLIFYIYLAARGVEGMGGGDVTLMAMVGAWLGWPALVFVFFAASLQALAAAGIAHLFGLDFLKDGAEVFADDEPLGFREKTPVVDADPKLSSEMSTEEDGDSDTIPTGKLAMPFGPFIALAAAEFLILGTYMPEALSLIYLYY